jgi:hypothetical protein
MVFIMSAEMADLMIHTITKAEEELPAGLEIFHASTRST